MPGTFNLSGFNAPPKVIINKFSEGGVTPVAIGTSVSVFPLGIKMTLSGELVAATYKEIINVAGAGVLHLAFVANQDATERTMGIKIVIDGVTVFDASCAATTAGPDVGIAAIGTFDNTASILIPASPSVPFNSSLSVQIKSSLNETDNVYLGCNYYTT